MLRRRSRGTCEGHTTLRLLLSHGGADPKWAHAVGQPPGAADECHRGGPRPRPVLVPVPHRGDRPPNTSWSLAWAQGSQAPGSCRPSPGPLGGPGTLAPRPQGPPPPTSWGCAGLTAIPQGLWGCCVHVEVPLPQSLGDSGQMDALAPRVWLTCGLRGSRLSAARSGQASTSLTASVTSAPGRSSSVVTAPHGTGDRGSSPPGLFAVCSPSDLCVCRKPGSTLSLFSQPPLSAMQLLKPPPRATV